MSVLPSRSGRRFPTSALVRASALHAGAAASAAALRRGLVDGACCQVLRLTKPAPSRASRQGRTCWRCTPCWVNGSGALGVLVWAMVRLLRPQLLTHQSRGIALAVATLAMSLMTPIPQFVILLIAGGLGAAILRVDE